MTSYPTKLIEVALPLDAINVASAREKPIRHGHPSWTAFVAREAEARGISWAYWEFCAGFGIYDPAESAWRRGLRDALIPPGGGTAP
jgi:hypothetical protein